MQMYETINRRMDHRQFPLAVTYVGDTGCNSDLPRQQRHDTDQSARRNLRRYDQPAIEVPQSQVSAFNVGRALTEQLEYFLFIVVDEP